MKIQFVEVAGFRGFREKTHFELPRGFVVLTGRNGTGKSTVLDAIDFALTGTINKFAVTGARGGGLDSHIWWLGGGAASEHYVRIGFAAEDGHDFVLTRERDGKLDCDSELVADILCGGTAHGEKWAETLMQTTLVRDETLASLSLDLPEQARFAAVRAAIGGLSGPDHSIRTSAVLREANTVRAERETRLKECEADLGRSLSALTEARSVADKQPDVADAMRILGAFAPDLASTTDGVAEPLRRRIAGRRQSIGILSDAIGRAESVMRDKVYFESEIGIAELERAAEAVVEAREVETRALRARDEILTKLASERAADAFATHLVSVLDHGEALGLQDGHCPLCDATRTDDEFAAAIQGARQRLDTRGERLSTLMKQQEDAEAAVAIAASTLAQALKTQQEYVERVARIEQTLLEVSRIFAAQAFDAQASDPSSAREALLRRQEQTASLEQALFILEASAAHDRVASLEARVTQLRSLVDEETTRLLDAERAVETARQIDSAAKVVANQVLTEQFDTVMPLLKELYRRLRPHADWQEIETDFGGRVRASLNFTVGDGKNPQFLFSSGQRRAAGLAFLLSIHLSRPWCRLRSLLLDDPVQHIDDYRALNLVEVLSAVRRTGRQVIVAVEDPALADLLSRRLRSSGTEGGRRFDLATGSDGASRVERTLEILPPAADVLTLAQAS